MTFGMPVPTLLSGAGAVIILILALWFFWPFLTAPFRRQGRYLFSLRRGTVKRDRLARGFDGTRASLYSTPIEIEDQRQQIVKNAREAELGRLEAEHDLRAGMLKERLDRLVSAERALVESNRLILEAIRNNAAGRAYAAISRGFNKEAGRNMLLLIVIAFFLAVDALIAWQIFKSLGLYTSESVRLFNHSVPVTFLYGLFLTITIAFLLHLLIPRERFRRFSQQSKWGAVIAVAALVTFFVVRLLTVAQPKSAQLLMEVVLLGCWVIGALTVYWLLGEIIGDRPDWFRLAVVFAAPLLLVLFVVFGIVNIGEIVGANILRLCFGIALGLRRTRLEKCIQNVEEEYLAVVSGFERALDG